MVKCRGPLGCSMRLLQRKVGVNALFGHERSSRRA
jgi:hypothetical protein